MRVDTTGLVGWATQTLEILTGLLEAQVETGNGLTQLQAENIGVCLQRIHTALVRLTAAAQPVAAWSPLDGQQYASLQRIDVGRPSDPIPSTTPDA